MAPVLLELPPPEGGAGVLEFVGVEPVPGEFDAESSSSSLPVEVREGLAEVLVSVSRVTATGVKLLSSVWPLKVVSAFCTIEPFRESQ